MRIHGFAWALLAAACVLLAPAASAEGRLQKVRGHLGVGYAKLLGSDTPAGSLSMGLGVDYPVGGRWRAGLAFAYELLGGRVVERGSQAASIDYSMVELMALAHFQPERFSPVGRVSVGGGLFSALAELTTAGGGAAFSDLAVEDLVPGLAADITLIQKRDAPVRIGFEMGYRVAFVPDDTWNLALVRVAFHY